MKHIVVFVLCIIPWVMVAQEKRDTVAVQGGSEIMVQIPLEELNNLKNEKDAAEKEVEALTRSHDSLQRQCAEKEARLDSLVSDQKFKSMKYKDLEQKYSFSEAEVREVRAQQKEADKCLFNVSVNFLFIAYEAYSIDSIAIPAFDAIRSKELKEKRKTDAYLLKHYKEHVRSFCEYLKWAEEELRKPFTKKGDGFIEKLQGETFYKDYKGYAHWKGTYLGKRIREIEGGLSQFENDAVRQTCERIRKELESCLKTAEAF